MSVGISEMHMW